MRERQREREREREREKNNTRQGKESGRYQPPFLT